MIVREASRHLLLHVRNPQEVLQTLPGARIINVSDVELVAVKHRTDTVRLLRNLGIHAPSPVGRYYNWPGRFPPLSHQRRTVEFLTENPRAYCFNDMGSGKTICALWSYDYLRWEGAVHRLLIVSPLSTLEPAWGAELFCNLPHLNYAVLHGAPAKRLGLLAQETFDVYIINHDGMTNEKVLDALCRRADIDTVIIDELASYRNRSTNRWKALDRFVNGVKSKGGVPDPAYPRREYVWGLTGTPTPNAPIDAYGQSRLITPWNVPRTFGGFQAMTMRRVSPFIWAPLPGATEVARKALQPAIRFARADCIDLPPTTYITRQADLTPEQRQAYEHMRKHLAAQTAQGVITAANEAVARGRLMQICAGASYSQNGDPIPLPCQTRIDATLEAIEEAGAKTIVYVPYTAALLNLAKEIGKRYRVAVVHGPTSRGERDRIFTAFQCDAAPHVLLVNPKAASHGLTLTAADTIIWFVPAPSNEIWEQANTRIVRPGQTRNTRIVCIQGSGVEVQAYKRLRARVGLQGLLLDLLRANS